MGPGELHPKLSRGGAGSGVCSAPVLAALSPAGLLVLPSARPEAQQ